jgi:L-fuconolactonase
MSSTPDASRPTHTMFRRNDDELGRWLASRPDEDVLEPELEIVDAHHHLWERPNARYLLPELLCDIGGGHNVTSTVYVEAGSMYRGDGPTSEAPIGEVEFANGIAAMSASGRYGPCKVAEAIVGRADLSAGAAVREVLEAELAVSGGRLRGIRHGLAWDPGPEISDSRKATGNKTPTSRFAPPHLALDPSFREGLSQLSSVGLAFDCFVFHPQLGEALELARAFPDTAIVLNHVGGVLGIGPYADRRREIFKEWCEAMDALARCPNVTVKLGGLGMALFGFGFQHNDLPPTSETLAAAWREYIERCIQSFGAERCMFESNFPPDKQSCSYTSLWNAFKRITASASPSEKSALYSGTARQVYRLHTVAT